MIQKTPSRYSSKVVIGFHIGDEVFDVWQVCDGTAFLRNDNGIPLQDATLVLQVDDEVVRQDVRILSCDGSNVTYEPIADPNC